MQAFEHAHENVEKVHKTEQDASEYAAMWTFSNIESLHLYVKKKKSAVADYCECTINGR